MILLTIYMSFLAISCLDDVETRLEVCRMSKEKKKGGTKTPNVELQLI